MISDKTAHNPPTSNPIALAISTQVFLNNLQPLAKSWCVCFRGTLYVCVCVSVCVSIYTKSDIYESLQMPCTLSSGRIENAHSTCSLSDFILNHSLNWMFGKSHSLCTYKLYTDCELSYPNYTQFKRAQSIAIYANSGSLCFRQTRELQSVFSMRFFFLPATKLVTLEILGASLSISTCATTCAPVAVESTNHFNDHLPTTPYIRLSEDKQSTTRRNHHHHH